MAPKSDLPQIIEQTVEKGADDAPGHHSNVTRYRRDLMRSAAHVNLASPREVPVHSSTVISHRMNELEIHLNVAHPLIALMLGFPVVTFAAAGAAVGLNPSFYSGAIGFVTGVCFIGAAFIEIHRLATTRSEDLVHGWMVKRIPELISYVEIASRHKIERGRGEVHRACHSGMPKPPLAPRQAAKAA